MYSTYIWRGVPKDSILNDHTAEARQTKTAISDMQLVQVPALIVAKLKSDNNTTNDTYTKTSNRYSNDDSTKRKKAGWRDMGTPWML